MADFAVWATACEQAFWQKGTFMRAYSDNLEEVVNTVIEADLVGAAVRQLAEERLEWKGTALGLLKRAARNRRRRRDPVEGLAEQSRGVVQSAASRGDLFTQGRG